MHRDKNLKECESENWNFMETNIETGGAMAKKEKRYLL